ncbi:MAG: hypothetical protein ACQGVK_19280 [Myxococcota bacterium]
MQDEHPFEHGTIVAVICAVALLALPACGTPNDGQSYLVTNGPLLRIGDVADSKRQSFPLRVRFQRDFAGRMDHFMMDSGEEEITRMLRQSGIWTAVERIEDARSDEPGAELDILLDKLSGWRSFGATTGKFFRWVFTLGIWGYDQPTEYIVRSTYRAPGAEPIEFERSWTIYSYEGLFIKEPEQYDGSSDAKFGSERKAEEKLLHHAVLRILSDLQREHRL